MENDFELSPITPTRRYHIRLTAFGLAYYERECARYLGFWEATNRQQREIKEHLASLAAEAQTREVDLQAGAEDLLAAFEHDPEPEFVHLVEEALRHMSDYTVLGQSPLAARLNMHGITHVERGKAVGSG